MKTAIFGGTFNPIHDGHIHIAESALKEYNLDRVIFIPTGISYMKQGVTPSIHRFNMTKLAIEDYDFFEISDLEVIREGYTYTKDTVKELTEIYPNDEFYFIIGTDTLFMMEKWVKPEYLFENLTILVADRGDKNSLLKAEEYKEKYNARIEFLKCDFLDISSSVIRSEIINDVNVSDVLNDLVYKYIIDNHLYKKFSEDEIIDLLRLDLKESRVVHTLGVRDEALILARNYGVDENKALLASLLHDCTKYMPIEEQIKLCERYFVKLSECEKENIGLLHSKSGACYAMEKYGIDDPEVIEAIKYHTTGRPDMNMLEKIIYISDYIEVNRNHSDKLPYYRELALIDIDLTVYYIVKDILDYIDDPVKEYKKIDPLTRETFEYYEKLISERG